MSWHRVAEETDIECGRAIVVAAGGKRIALCNNGDAIYAIDDKCTHDGGPLNQGKLLDDHRIECPRHGAQFDITTGQALTLPAIRPIKTYNVRIEDGAVEVEV